MNFMCVIKLMLFCLPLANSLQIKRQKTGDKLTNGSTCENGTYVMKESAMQTIKCVKYMPQADCEWMFYLWPDQFIGFVPRYAFKKKSLRVTLTQKASYPNGTNCSNHTAGRIDVQSVNVTTSSVWDSYMGEKVKKTLTYQFNYAKQFVEIGFQKHWDGMLIKLFINCLDDTGKNILNYSATRCVMIKYEGNTSYLTALPKTSASVTLRNNLTTAATSTTLSTEPTFINSKLNDTESKDSNDLIIAIISGVAGVLLIIIIVLLVLRRRGKRRKYPRPAKNEKIITSNQQNNPTYHAENDAHLTPTNCNKTQIDEKVIEFKHEIPEYAVVDKVKHGSAEESFTYDSVEKSGHKAVSQSNEQDYYSVPIIKRKADDFHHDDSSLYYEAATAAPPVVLDEYAVIDKSRKVHPENPYSFS